MNNEIMNNLFAKFIKITIRINDKYYKQVMKRRYN